MASSFKFGVGVILSTLMLYGTYDLFMNLQPNKCEMTYMFENPQYIEIKISDENVTMPHYKLYVYGEGNYAKSLSEGVFRGIPVLFIPGNQGSYKQVRSLASVAYRKYLSEKHSFHFNFFSIDFNEELGAFFGPALEQQMLYVGTAIKRILELYKNSQNRPSSVVLVGHSLGGLIARAVVMLPDISASLVPIIISQATPHKWPVIIPDSSVISFYEKVNTYWTLERYMNLENIVFVTVGGGRNDIQVSSFYTASDLADIDTTTSSVPSCWLTADHLAIVWCRQLVLATIRALFDSVDSSFLLISSNRTRIVEAFKYQLLERSGSKHSFPLEHQPLLTGLKEKNGQWLEINKKQHRKELVKSSKHIFMMVPLLTNQSNHLTIIGKELDWKCWVMICKVDTNAGGVPMCSSAENLSQNGRIIPNNRKEINIEITQMVTKGFTHVVAWSHPNDDRVIYEFDMSDGDTRRMKVVTPTFLSSFSPIVITKSTPHKALTYNLTIEGITEFWQSFSLLITPLKSCPSKSSYPLVSMKSSWSLRWDYIMSSHTSPYEFIIEVDVPPTGNQKVVDVHVILDPMCLYTISLSKNIQGIFRRISLLYGSQIPAFLVCHFLIILSQQLKSMAVHRKCSSVFTYIFILSPIAVVPFVKLLSYGFAKFAGIDSDPSILARNKVDIGVLPILLFLSTLPIALILATILWILVLAFGNAAHSFAVRFLKQTMQTGDILTEVALQGFWKIPAVGVAVLLAMSFSTCGSLGLIITLFMYFIKIFKMYEDSLEDFVISLLPGVRRRDINEQDNQLSSIHIHFTMMILTLFVSMLNLPPLITWCRMIMSNGKLASDPSLPTCVVSLVAIALLWQIKSFNPNKKFYKHLGYIVQCSSVFVILFGSIHIYRTSVIASTTILIVAIHQLLVPNAYESNAELSEDYQTLPYMATVNSKENIVDGTAVPESEEHINNSPEDDRRVSSLSSNSD